MAIDAFQILLFLYLSALLPRNVLSDLQHIISSRHTVHIISPPLHHFPAFWQILCMVIGRSHLVTLTVCKLAFDHLRREAVFIEDGAGGGAEAVAGGAAVITHAV